MTNLKGLSVNQIVEVKVNTGEFIGVYPSRVEDMEKGKITLAAPIKSGYVVPLTANTELEVSYFHQNAIYSFATYILDRQNSPLPMLVVKQPTYVKRIQRRSFVRFEAKLPLRVCLLTEALKNSCAGIYVKTIDISGGGLSFESNEKFEPKNELSLEINLSEQDTVNAAGTVVRVKTKDNTKKELIYSVAFSIIEESERDKIIKYIFNKQRELRAKGLL